MAYIIDGKKISTEIKDETRDKVAELKAAGKEISLAVVQVGDNPASCVYVRNKKKACEYVGIKSVSHELPEETTEAELLELIDKLNNDDTINGILVQLPLPAHMDENKVIDAISPYKDVDGFHLMNVGALSTGQNGFISCTPYGIIQLLKRSGIEIAGKHCVVIGRSNIVGKPVAKLLLDLNCNVTILHSRTTKEDMAFYLKHADIIVVAVGKKHFITDQELKPSAILVDVGINRFEGKLYGDCAPNLNVALQTPVPGGVGLLTRVALLENLFICYNNRRSN